MNCIKYLRMAKNSLIMFTVLLMVSCSSESSSNPDDDSIIITPPSTSGIAEGDIANFASDEDDIVANSTFSDNVVKIVFSGTTAVVTNPFNGAGVTISQNAGDVLVECAISGVAFEISGTTTNGSLKIYSDKKLKLTINGASITNSDGPAINIQSAKTAFVVLKGLSSLTDASVYSNLTAGEDAKGTFFSEGQIVFSGSGSLTVAGKHEHSIVSDRYIRIIEGNLTVTESSKDAIHANEYIVIDGGTINVTAGTDGIDCELGYIVINGGNFSINAGDDGISASYDITIAPIPDVSITPYVTINNGTFTINTENGEGISCMNSMTINNGIYTINSEDDGFSANEDLYINGGRIYINSTSDDAIDANRSLTVTGGITIALGTTIPESGFDANQNMFKITGGTLLGLAGTTTSPTSAVCTQNSLIFDGFSEGTILSILSEDKTEALTFLVPKTINTILYSSAKLVTGKIYNIYTGGSISGGEDFNGLYTSGSYYEGTTQNISFTINDRVTQIGGQLAE